MNLPPDELRHGTSHGYNLGCRCDECRTAGTGRLRRWRERFRTYPPEAIPHGTTGGYANYGCRCDECRYAKSAANAAEYAKRRARDVGGVSAPGRHGASPTPR